VNRALFFSPLELNDAGVPITKNTRQFRCSGETGEGKERTRIDLGFFMALT